MRIQLQIHGKKGIRKMEAYARASRIVRRFALIQQRPFDADTPAEIRAQESNGKGGRSK